MKRMIGLVLLLFCTAGVSPQQKQEWIAHMAYREGPFDAKLTRRDPVGVCEQFRVEMPSPLKSASEANNTIVGLYYRPALPARAAVIVLPIAYSPHLTLERIIATYLSHRGFKTFIMPMPYQQGRGRDTGATNTISLAGRDNAGERLYEAGAQAVMDVKRVRHWLVRDEGVDPDRVGLVGVSLGSLVASIAFSIDTDFRAAALVLCGGDLGQVIWNESRETKSEKKALIRAGKDIEWARQLTAPLDPLTYATPLRRAGLLMVNAEDDQVFPRQGTVALRHAYGDPPILMLPGNHYTVALFLPFVLDRVAAHLSRELLQPMPATAPATQP